MKFLLTSFSILAMFYTNAQNIKLSSNTYDNEGGIVAFATVSLNKNQVATTSDIDGNFSLIVNLKSLPDTLIIRHISYETKKILLDKNNYNQFGKVVLKIKANQINTSVVTASTAEQIIIKAINKISVNYHSKQYYINGFYRQAHKENDKYVRLIDCFVDIEENTVNRNSTEQKEKFRIEEIRRSNVYERNGDKHGDHLADLFSEDPIIYAHSSFLNAQSYKNYSFSYLESTNSDLIHIYFQNKNWSEHKNKSGYIIINRNDYAIVEMEITSTRNPLDKTDYKSDWKFQNGTYKVQYIKEDGKYFCKRSSKYYNHYVLNEFTQNVAYLVEEYFDWWTESISFEHTSLAIVQHHSGTNEHGPWKSSKIIMPFKSLSNLYSIDYRYNPAFWEHKLRHSLNKKIKDDLNSFMDLEKQFIND